MRIKTEARSITVSLRLRHNNGYMPDCFDDLETNFPLDHPDRSPAGEILAPEKALTALLEWWEEECNNANKGYDHNLYSSYNDYLNNAPEHVLNALDDEALAAGDLWILETR